MTRIGWTAVMVVGLWGCGGEKSVGFDPGPDVGPKPVPVEPNPAMLGSWTGTLRTTNDASNAGYGNFGPLSTSVKITKEETGVWLTGLCQDSSRMQATHSRDDVLDFQSSGISCEVTSKCGTSTLTMYSARLLLHADGTRTLEVEGQATTCGEVFRFIDYSGRVTSGS